MLLTALYDGLILSVLKERYKLVWKALMLQMFRKLFYEEIFNP